MRFSSIVIAAAVGLASAQRPANESICDYYTTALLKENNSTNQLTVLTLIVNTALIGNYSTINVGIPVTGILAPGKYNGTDVNLLPYFDGSLVSTNRGSAKAVNFLDDGGAAPLMKNMASAGNMTSNQYLLITHLYSFFGILAGCSKVGTGSYPAYGGNTNMYNVHKYMDLNPTEMAYFITQVGTAAASFGVATEDVMALGNALTTTFNYRCSAPVTIVPGAPAEPQTMCQDATCPLAANATCMNEVNGTAPVFASNGTNFTGPSATSGGSPSGSSGSPSSTSSKAAATLLEVGGLLGLAGMVAMAVV